MTRPSDDAIWASIAATLRDIVLPTVDDEWARQSVIQLVGLAEYARSRPADDEGDRVARLRGALDSLQGNPLLVADDDPEAAAAATLVRAVGHDDEHAVAIRTTLHEVLLAELDAELEETVVLDEPFRGRLPDA